MAMSSSMSVVIGMGVSCLVPMVVMFSMMSMVNAKHAGLGLIVLAWYADTIY